jgi:DNA-binding transcriptional regulator YdaS (Cro superfamily)
MPYVETLIDKASKACGNDTKLAKRLGISVQVMSDLRTGRRTITPETAAELADIAGDDAREAAIAAIIERSKGTRREGRLRDVLGKALAAGVAGMLVFSYSGDSISSTRSQMTTSHKSDDLHIVLSNLTICLWAVWHEQRRQ